MHFVFKGQELYQDRVYYRLFLSHLDVQTAIRGYLRCGLSVCVWIEYALV